MYLADANIWLEVLLDRAHADEARRFLDKSQHLAIHLTDFSLHSIGVILVRPKRLDLLQSFVEDLQQSGTVGIVGVTAGSLTDVVAASRQHRLDFDDAYQYIAAEQNNLTLVSLDHDFDHTPRGRMTPADVLKTLTEEP
ncbi:MAG: PIN domain-containing protein [Phycisphaeraceae bacterium]